jgi:hypothetical protein
MDAESKKNLPQWTRMPAELLIPDPQIAEYIATAHDHIANGLKSEDGELVPQYGLLSLKAQMVPVLAYGSDHLKGQYPNSFNEGQSIFISDRLAKSIAIEEASSQGERKGIVPLVLLHEMHVIMNHGNRMKDFPDNVAQIATEASAYSKLKMGFPEMKWAQCVERDIPASTLPESSIKRYSRMAEETIAREILAECQRVCPAEQAAPSDATLKKALGAMGFKPELCAHPTCKDPGAIGRALASDQREQISRAVADKPTLLHMAAGMGDAAAVEALLPISDAEARDGSGRTALRIAAEAGAEQAVRLLIPASNLSAVGRDGVSAAEAARGQGHSRIAELIEERAVSQAIANRGEQGLEQKRGPSRRL